MLHYGLVNEKEFYLIVDEIVEVLGNGKNESVADLLIETARAETMLGKAEDRTPLMYGVGIMQFDEIGFNDVKERSAKHRDLIKNNLNIDINLVKFEWLAYNPFLSVLWARLKYKLIPEEVPSDIYARAKYWKRYYNTFKGKGTITHYLKNNGVL